MGFFKSLFGGTGSPATSSESKHGKSASGSLGYVRGRHFTEWTEEVKQLKRDGKQQDVIDLCLEAIEATEAECKVDRLSVAPWWYEQVALAARRSGQPDVERSAMERYLAHPSQNHPDYEDKFTRFLSKLDAAEGQA